MPILTQILAQVKKASPELVFFPGDSVTGAVKLKAHRFQLAEFRKLVKKYLGEIPFYAVLGNHESGTRKHLSLFKKTFPAPQNGPKKYRGLAYHLRHKGVLFVALSTDSPAEMGLISDEQLQWLDRILGANADAEHIYVMGHQPAFPVGRHVGLSLDQYPEQRDRFWTLLRKHRVEAYFCGHEHLYNMKVVQGIYQIVVGSAGAKIYQGLGGEFHNFAEVEVEGGYTRVTIKDEKGKVRRHYTFRRRTTSELLTIEEMDRMSPEQIRAALEGKDDVLAWKAVWSAWRRNLREVLPQIHTAGMAAAKYKNDPQKYLFLHSLRAAKFMPSKQGLPLIRVAFKSKSITVHQEAVAAMAAYKRMKRDKKAAGPGGKTARSGDVHHLVFCWLKDAGNATQRRKIIAAAEAFRTIPGVLSVRVGNVIESERSVVDDSYDVAFSLSFANAKQMKTYLAHPEHQKAKKEILKPLVKKILVYDFGGR